MESDNQGAPCPGETAGIACPICSNPKTRVLPFRYAFSGRYLYGRRCTWCATVFIQPQPTKAEIADLYREEYFTAHSETCGAHGPAAYMEMAISSGAERASAARRLDARIRKYRSIRGRLLEVGCGPGFFLAAMRDLGWNVEGLEISSFAVRHAREDLGLEVVHGGIVAGVFSPETFDAVFLGDVLEHLPDPLESLRIIRDWLKPGGVLVVAVPSTMNLLSARLGLWGYGIQKRFKTLRLPPYHLFEYTPGSLRRTLVASGFAVLEVAQSAVPLGKMGLRGTRFENAGKASLQVCALLTSRFLNRWGDRLTAIARNE